MKLHHLSNFQFKLLLAAQPRPHILSLDLGSQSTGLAHSCDHMKEAFFLRTIRCNNVTTDSSFYNTLKQVCEKEKVTGLVVGKAGYPDAEQRKEIVIGKLSNYIQLPYTDVDESSTTIDASNVLMNFQRAMGKIGHLHRQKDLKDGIAAMIILQRFLDYYNKK